MSKIKGWIITAIVVFSFTASIILGGGWLANSIPEAEYIKIKSGKVMTVAYLQGNSSNYPKTILSFDDGSIISVCGTHSIPNINCVDVYDVQNKSCIYSYIEACK